MSRDEQLPDYLEKHDPVYEVDDCPVRVMKLSLDGDGNSTEANVTTTGCAMHPRDSDAGNSSSYRAEESAAEQNFFEGVVTAIKSYKDSPYFIPGIAAFALGLLVLLLVGLLVWQCRKRAMNRAQEAMAMQFLTASELAAACAVESGSGNTPFPSQFPSPLMSSTATSAIPAREIAPYDINVDFMPPPTQRTPRVYSYNMLAKK